MVCQTLCQNNVAGWGSLEENEESNCPITTVTTPQKMVVGTTSNIIQHQKSWPTQQLIKPAPFASAPFHWARSDPWFQHPPSWRRASPSVAPCVLAPIPVPAAVPSMLWLGPELEPTLPSRCCFYPWNSWKQKTYGNTTRKTSPFRSKTNEFHCFRHGPW